MRSLATSRIPAAAGSSAIPKRLPTVLDPDPAEPSRLPRCARDGPAACRGTVDVWLATRLWQATGVSVVALLDVGLPSASAARASRRCSPTPVSGFCHQLRRRAWTLCRRTVDSTNPAVTSRHLELSRPDRPLVVVLHSLPVVEEGARRAGASFESRDLRRGASPGWARITWLGTRERSGAALWTTPTCRSPSGCSGPPPPSTSTTPSRPTSWPHWRVTLAWFASDLRRRVWSRGHGPNGVGQSRGGRIKPAGTVRPQSISGR
jgi:hypothetical protein